MPLVEALKARARQLKAETFALCLAARHRDTPWLARLVVAAVAAYALSPIDLIPDFIPVLGYVDDLILLPAGIALAVALIPAAVMRECRAAAAARMQEARPHSRIAAVVIVAIWLVLAALGATWAWRLASPG